MTRKDYIKLASVFKHVKQMSGNVSQMQHTRLYIQDRVADILRQDNPRFDLQKWEAYING